MTDVQDDHDLISSSRVEGTAVYDRHGEKFGSIHSLMVHKETGQVAYAVLHFGGFLGIGNRCLPLPWEKLRYDRELKGYQLEVTREEVEAAPYMALDKTRRPQEMPEPLYRHWDQYM
jgi:hypothetical protein